ncbi:MAG: hypothetical protein AB8B67_02300 [Rickettsiaceae bacterium]
MKNHMRYRAHDSIVKDVKKEFDNLICSNYQRTYSEEAIVRSYICNLCNYSMREYTEGKRNPWLYKKIDSDMKNMLNFIGYNNNNQALILKLIDIAKSKIIDYNSSAHKEIKFIDKFPEILNNNLSIVIESNLEYDDYDLLTDFCACNN